MRVCVTMRESKKGREGKGKMRRRERWRQREEEDVRGRGLEWYDTKTLTVLHSRANVHPFFEALESFVSRLQVVAGQFARETSLRVLPHDNRKNYARARGTF